MMKLNLASLPAIATVIVVILVIASAFAGIFPLPWRSNKLNILLDTRAITVVDNSTTRPLSSIKGGVLLVETHLPYPHGDAEAFLLGRTNSANVLQLSIKTSKALSAWKKLYTTSSKAPAKLSVEERMWSKSLPVLTVLVLLYTPDGKEYIGGATLSPISLLLAKNPRLSYQKAYQLASRDPGGLLGRVYSSGTIVLRNIKLYRIDIGKAIDNAIAEVQRILHGKPIRPKIGIEYWSPEPGYPGIYYEVYNQDLYNLHNQPPPQQWYQRIRLDNGQPAPSSDVDALWKIYTEHFSKVYYIDKNTYSLEQALRFAYVAASDGQTHGDKAWLIRPMWEFLTDLAHYRAHIYHYYTWQNTQLGIENGQLSVVCVKADYNQDNPLSSSVSTIIHYRYTNYTDIVKGLSLFGFITISKEKIEVAHGSKLPPPKITKKYPKACIDLDYTIGPGMLGDLAITIVDLSTYGNYWVVKPAVIFVPSIYLSIDYLHPTVSEKEFGYDKFIWSDNGIYEVFNDYVHVKVVNHVEMPFFSDSTTVSDSSLGGFCGSVVNYYFPYLGKLLDTLGFVNAIYGLYSTFVGAATVSASPYMAAALTIVELAKNSLQIAIHQAYASRIYIDVSSYADNEQGQVYVAIYKRSLVVMPNVEGDFMPLRVDYYMSIGYPPGSPGGHYLPTSIQRNR